MTGLIAIQLQGRILANGSDRYELPRDSADLYENSFKYREIWGDDFFFSACDGEMPEPQNGMNFVFTDDRDLILSQKIAFNPKAPQGTPAQEAAREVFKQWRESADANIRLFPTMLDIRERKPTGRGLTLISGGAFVFIIHDFGEGPETRLPLFERTYKPLVFTEANGYVAEPHTAAKETLEEYAIVGITADDNYTVYAFDFPSGSLADEDYVAVKAKQEPVLRRNLAKIGIYPNELVWKRSGIEKIIPLPEHNLTLYTSEGRRVDCLSGITGEQHNLNDVVYKWVGQWRPPADIVKLWLIDGEYDRVGHLVTATEFAAISAQGAVKIMPSTGAIGESLLKHWPRPVAGSKTRFEAPRPNGAGG